MSICLKEVFRSSIKWVPHFPCISERVPWPRRLVGKPHPRLGTRPSSEAHPVGILAGLRGQGSRRLRLAAPLPRSAFTAPHPRLVRLADSAGFSQPQQYFSLTRNQPAIQPNSIFLSREISQPASQPASQPNKP